MNIVKIRTQKNYSEASNHVLIGSVVESNKIFIRLNCKSFHYKSPTLELDQVTEGEIGERLIPWNNVECINILSDEFDWKKAVLDKCNNGICLKYNDQSTLISRYRTTHR